MWSRSSPGSDKRGDEDIEALADDLAALLIIMRIVVLPNVRRAVERTYVVANVIEQSWE